MLPAASPDELAMKGAKGLRKGSVGGSCSTGAYCAYSWSSAVREAVLSIEERRRVGIGSGFPGYAWNGKENADGGVGWKRWDCWACA